MKKKTEFWFSLVTFTERWLMEFYRIIHIYYYYSTQRNCFYGSFLKAIGFYKQFRWICPDIMVRFSKYVNCITFFMPYCVYLWFVCWNFSSHHFVLLLLLLLLTERDAKSQLKTCLTKDNFYFYFYLFLSLFVSQ